MNKKLIIRFSSQFEQFLEHATLARVLFLLHGKYKKKIV